MMFVPFDIKAFISSSIQLRSILTWALKMCRFSPSWKPKLRDFSGYLFHNYYCYYPPIHVRVLWVELRIRYCKILRIIEIFINKGWFEHRYFLFLPQKIYCFHLCLTEVEVLDVGLQIRERSLIMPPAEGGGDRKCFHSIIINTIMPRLGALVK